MKRLSGRARNTLANGGVDSPTFTRADFKTTVAYERARREWQPDPLKVAKLEFLDLIQIPGCGRGMIHEIDMWLASYGLSIGYTGQRNKLDACPCCGRPY